MAHAPRHAFLVSHTHWDREWYETFDHFRVRLVRIVDRILEALESDSPFRHFVLDGQAIVLEDYLQARPQDGERIRRLVEAGALSLGPWYILPDEFLVSGEATVRNLQIGHRIAEQHGGVQKIGYMPDSFGHIAQMPQILRRAGIDSFIYTRGNGDEIDETGWEYRWRSPDGSEVLAINQCGGYCNAGGLGFQEIWHAHTRRTVDLDRAVEQVTDLFERISAGANTDVALLNNGCDHFPPQQAFGAVLDALRDAFPDTRFDHGNFDEYLDAVRATQPDLRTFTGELSSGRLHHLLSGVWSARMYLKTRNDEVQSSLARVTEPLLAYAHFVHGQSHPTGLLDYAWKKLLENHPHDSICGCSTDEVHRDMVPRFEAALRTADGAVRQALECLAPTFARDAANDDRTILCVANPLPERRDAVVSRMVVFQPFGFDVEDLELSDGAGNPVPFDVVDVTHVERFWGIDYRTLLHYREQREAFGVYLDHFHERMVKQEQANNDSVVTIEFVARDLPGVGHRTFHIGPPPTTATDAPALVPEQIVVSGTNTLDNGLIGVTLHANGSFDLDDHRTGRSYTGLHALEDTGDAGDEYDYQEVGDIISGDPAPSDAVRTVWSTRFRGVLEARFTLTLPSRIDPDRVRRSNEETQSNVQVRVGLTAGSPVVEIETRITNRSEDHRLRASFPTGTTADSWTTDNQFLLEERPRVGPAGENWVQPPTPTRPQQDFSMVRDEDGGLAVLVRGLPEVEARDDGPAGTSLVVTLLRCVGWLSRDDFPSRRSSNAGPTIYTPEAQCLGTHEMRYAVLPLTTDDDGPTVKEWSDRYRTPVVAVQGIEDQHAPGGRGLVRKTTNRTAVTAIRKHTERDTLIVRLYNLGDTPVEETLVLGLPVESAWRTDILEERESSLSIDESGHGVVLPVGPHEIVTAEVAIVGEARHR